MEKKYLIHLFIWMSTHALPYLCRGSDVSNDKREDFCNAADVAIVDETC